MSKLKKIPIKVLIGLPASGKSTWRQDFVSKNPNTLVVSRDDLVEEYARSMGVTYDDVFMESAKFVDTKFKELMKSTLYQMRDGSIPYDYVVFDNTNLTSKKRESVFREFSIYSLAVDYVFFTPPKSFEHFKEWERRNNSRVGKTIPEKVLFSMYKSYDDVVDFKIFTPSNIEYVDTWGREDSFREKMKNTLANFVYKDNDDDVINTNDGYNILRWARKGLLDIK